MRTAFIIDTNVWLRYIQFTADLLDAVPQFGHRLILPNAVLLELDGIKTRPGGVGYQARAAQRFIYSRLSTRDPGLVAQKQRDVVARFLKGDDAILDCALYFMASYKLVLIAEDINFSSRAMVEGITAITCRNHTVRSIIQKYVEELSLDEVLARAVSPTRFLARAKPVEIVELSPEPEDAQTAPQPEAARAPTPPPAPITEMSPEPEEPPAQQLLTKPVEAGVAVASQPAIQETQPAAQQQIVWPTSLRSVSPEPQPASPGPQPQPTSPEPRRALVETQPNVEHPPELAVLKKDRTARKIEIKCRSKQIQLLQTVLSRHHAIHPHVRTHLAGGNRGIKHLAEVCRSAHSLSLPPTMVKAIVAFQQESCNCKKGERLRYFLRLWGSVCMALDPSPATRAACLQIWNAIKEVPLPHVPLPKSAKKRAALAAAEAVAEAPIDAVFKGEAQPAVQPAAAKPAAQPPVTTIFIDLTGDDSDDMLDEEHMPPVVSQAPSMPAPSAPTQAPSRKPSRNRTRTPFIPTPVAPKIIVQGVSKCRSERAAARAANSARARVNEENRPIG